MLLRCHSLGGVGKRHSAGAGTFNHATATSGVKVAQHPVMGQCIYAAIIIKPRMAQNSATMSKWRGELLRSGIYRICARSARPARRVNNGLPFGVHPRERVLLTTKALAAINAVPEKLGQSIGSQLANAAKQGASNAGKLKLAELVGTLLGSFTGSATKSIGGG